MSTELKTGYETEGGQVVTPKARASFCYAFRPQEPDAENGLKEAKYSIALLFTEESDLTLLKNAAMAAVTAEWGSDPEKWPANLKKPFRDQGEKKFEGYEPGRKFIIATSKYKPEIVGPSGKPLIGPADDLSKGEALLYAGCWVRASVNAFTYKTGGNVGVAFGLNNIQKLDDDEPLGGRERAASQFKPVAPAKGSEAPAASGGGATKAALFDD
jgi:hypothetical protein